MRSLSALAAAVALSGCALAPGLPKETGGSAFVIEKDLLGETTARGQFSAINGVKRAFTAHLTGTRSGDTFTLAEKFDYDDGEKDQKTWVLTLLGDGKYLGKREDVVGTAKGWQDGKAFRLSYDVVLPGENGKEGLKVHFQDVMVLNGEGAVINRASVGKFGFQVASVELTIKR
ncbi:MAG TPA: DUF3833 family protein [Hyphomonadaceae bacterium]|jgi:hypothetical protein|nr:DUF3833 family protein [Hyphomonadaceae bacterium]